MEQTKSIPSTEEDVLYMQRALALAKEAGVVMTDAGATYPYGIDPMDTNIRIAPSLPPVSELEQAMAVFCLCLKIAAFEKELGI